LVTNTDEYGHLPGDPVEISRVRILIRYFETLLTKTQEEIVSGRSARRSVAGLGLLVTGALLLAACGSSSSNTSTSAAPTTSSAPTSSSAPAPEPTNDAAAKVAAYEAVPTTIGITEPLTSPIPAGKNVVWMECQLPQCTQIGQGVKDAAAAAQWNLKVINYDSSDPATLVAGMKQALRDKPDALINSGLPVAAWQAVLPDFVEAGVPIVTMHIGPQELVPGLIANLYGVEDQKIQSDMIAQWMINKSNSSANILIVDVPDFPILHQFSVDFEESIKRDCSGCKTQTISVSIADVLNGSLVPATVSALQADPSIDYVYVCDGDFIPALPAGLKAAGLSPQVGAVWGSKATEAFLPTGEIGALTGFSTEYNGWQAIDAIARHLQGIALQSPSNGNAPTQLITATSMVEPMDSYNMPADFREQFKALWKI
jgi:ribose transport system substrate-binding protein